MRAYFCPDCDLLHAVGDFGAFDEGFAHSAADGSTHRTVVAFEIPEKERAGVLEWHRKQGDKRTTRTEMLEHFPGETERNYEPPTVTHIGSLGRLDRADEDTRKVPTSSSTKITRKR
jgi:hypothetical protein